MVVLSINLFILSIGILIVGLIKPGWILFWMEKPSRLPIIALSSILFMVAAVIFGETKLKSKDQSTINTQQEVLTPEPVENNVSGNKEEKADKESQAIMEKNKVSKDEKSE